MYVAGLFATDYVHLLITPGTKAADVAGIAMILILLTANGIVRRRHYEFFYVAHCVLIIVSLITGKSSGISFQLLQYLFTSLRTRHYLSMLVPAAIDPIWVYAPAT